MTGMRSRLELDGGLAVPEFADRPPAPVEPVARGSEETTEFGPEAVRLAEELPPDVAILCVSHSTWEDRPSFSLTFHFRGEVGTAAAPGDLAEQRPPGLSLAELEAAPEGPRKWRDSYVKVMSWWATKRKLVGWMRRLLAEDGTRLVVWDNTSYEIPWELFHHHHPGGPDGWLGELIPVIRWTSVHDGLPPWYYSARRHTCVGGVLMMEDPDLKVDPDGFAEYEIEPRRDSMENLMIRLDLPSRRFGMLMVRCHGEYSQNTGRFTLGGFSLDQYTEFTMPALRDAGALVLLNACVSARPVADERHPGTAVRSFAELFLRYGAGGVIAAVGDIDRNHSHDFALRLLADAADDELNLAEALLRHRRYYARSAKRRPGEVDRRDEEVFKRFFSSFMYVYYGHPETTLRSRPALGRGALS